MGDDARKKFGEEQVHIWRRSYDVPPPGGESLELTAKRTLPYYNEKIAPLVEEGKGPRRRARQLAPLDHQAAREPLAGRDCQHRTRDWCPHRLPPRQGGQGSLQGDPQAQELDVPSLFDFPSN